MEIRKFELKDLPQLSELFDMYRKFYRQESDLEGCMEFIKERTEKNESVIFVAEAEGKIVGFVQLYPSFSSVALKKLWILNDMYVTEKKRRHGVAIALMEKAEQFARSTGARGMTLKTAISNYKSQRLYEKRKWRKEDSFVSYNLRFNDPR